MDEILTLKGKVETLLRMVGTVTEEQICAFCKGYASNESIEYIFKCMDRNNMICKTKNVYTLRHRSMGMHLADEVIDALWVAIGFGGYTLRDITITDCPTVLMFITEDWNVYDVSVFYTEGLAARTITWSRELQYSLALPPDVQDQIIHLAVVSDHECAKQLAPLGLDAYCIVDAQGNVQFYNW